MFDSLSDRLGSVFDKLTRRASLSESDVRAAMREVRVALLEADVALPVVKDFIADVTEKSVGADVLRSVTPGQQVIKIVHDALVEMLGTEGTELNLQAVAPVPFLMVGLQGSGKTTTTAKIGLHLKDKQKKKVLMVSLDTYRPAAQEQLRILGEQTDVATLPIVEGQKPVQIAKRGLDEAKKGGFDVVVFDTAGRLHIDDALMAEVAEIRKAVSPVETLLVTDAMAGQDAVTVAKEFHDKIGVTGIALTRVDGDARGGAALSMRAVTGQPIKLMGVGEKASELEPFHADRIAGRILGMGDVVSLVEKAAETIDQEEAEKVAKRLMAGTFTFDDMLSQYQQLRSMGDLKGLLGMIPGLGKLMKQGNAAELDEKVLARQEAMILSMTPQERAKPMMIKASRKQRIAAGSGTSVQDVNKLIKQYQMMAGMLKKAKKKGGMAMPDMGALAGGGAPDLTQGLGLPPGGGLPGAGLPGGSGLPGGLSQLPPGFPGTKK